MSVSSRTLLSCWRAISPLHEFPNAEYCALRLGAADRWFCGSSCKLSRLLMCIGPESVVSVVVSEVLSRYCAANAVRLGPVSMEPVFPSVLIGIAYLVWCSGNCTRVVGLGNSLCEFRIDCVYLKFSVGLRSRSIRKLGDGPGFLMYITYTLFLS